MLKHTTEGIIKMPLEYWQAWDINHLSGKLVPVFIHTHGAEVFPYVQSSVPLPELCAIPTSCHQFPRAEPRTSPCSGSCSEHAGHLSASSSPHWMVQVSSAYLHRTCLPVLLSGFHYPPLSAFKDLNILFIFWITLWIYTSMWLLYGTPHCYYS